MNFALEELRQVDWLVIKIKKVPFPLFPCSLFFQSRGIRQNFLFLHPALQSSNFAFCSFSILWHSVELTFSALTLANIKTCFCSFSFWFPRRTLKKQCPTFPRQIPLFRKLMFSASRLYFLQQKLASQHSAFAFSKQIYFPLHAFEEGYNKGLTRVL